MGTMRALLPRDGCENLLNLRWLLVIMNLLVIFHACLRKGLHLILRH